jgi:hypothetical protein
VGYEGCAYGHQRSPHSLDAAFAALAGRQHGVVSGSQLRRLGVTKYAVRRRVEAGRLLRLHDGVYAVGHLALTADSRRMAAVLACGPGALLSHRAAGVLWGFLRGAAALEVTTPRSRRRRPGIVIHRSRVIHPDDRAAIRAIPVTGVARTLVDLADVLDDEGLANAVNQAELQRVFDLGALTVTLHRLPGRTGRHRLRRVLAAYRSDPRVTRSEGERRFLALCARHGLPLPQTNLWIGRYEVDAYWPDARLAVEIDGDRFHRTRRAFREDRARDRYLATLGIQSVRVTWHDLDAGAQLAEELRAIRSSRLVAA